MNRRGVLGDGSASHLSSTDEGAWLGRSDLLDSSPHQDYSTRMIRHCVLLSLYPGLILKDGTVVVDG